MSCRGLLPRAARRGRTGSNRPGRFRLPHRPALRSRLPAGTAFPRNEPPTLQPTSRGIAWGERSPLPTTRRRARSGHRTAPPARPSHQCASVDRLLPTLAWTAILRENCPFWHFDHRAAARRLLVTGVVDRQAEGAV